jgi:hypothetical protein
MLKHLGQSLLMFLVASACSRAHEDSSARPPLRTAGVAVWRGDTLLVPVRSGDSLRFADEHDEYAPVTNRLLDPLPSGHYVVMSQFEDGTRVSVIDPNTGALIELSAPPLPSPSGRLLVAADPDALYDDFFTVWRLDSTGWQREYAAPNDFRVAWAPRSVRWIDDSTLALTQEFFDSTRASVLFRRDGRWMLQAWALRPN